MCSTASFKFNAGEEDGTKSHSNSNSAGAGESWLARSSVVEVRGMKINSAHDGTDAALKVSNDTEECNTSDTECSTVTDSYRNEDEDHSIRYEHQKQLIPFPLQLMDLIENESVDENAATINGYKALEWLPTGDKFILRDRRTVETCVLTKYFSNNCKFMSFVRKLYRWGFRQVEKNASDVMVFSHKKFIRGDPKKCRGMRSIVKRPPLASTAFTSSLDAGKVEVGAAPNAGGVMAIHLLNHQGIYHSNRIRSDGSFFFNAVTGEGANLGYSSQPNHHYNGLEPMMLTNPREKPGVQYDGFSNKDQQGIPCIPSSGSSSSLAYQSKLQHNS